MNALENIDDAHAHITAAFDSLERSVVRAGDDPVLLGIFQRARSGLVAATLGFRAAADLLRARANESASEARPP